MCTYSNSILSLENVKYIENVQFVSSYIYNSNVVLTSDELSISGLIKNTSNGIINSKIRI